MRFTPRSGRLVHGAQGREHQLASGFFFPGHRSGDSGHVRLYKDVCQALCTQNGLQVQSRALGNRLLGKLLKVVLKNPPVSSRLTGTALCQGHRSVVTPGLELTGVRAVGVWLAWGPLSPSSDHLSRSLGAGIPLLSSRAPFGRLEQPAQGQTG